MDTEHEQAVNGQSHSGSQFDCHICLCTASDPVVTLCAFLLGASPPQPQVNKCSTASRCRCGHLYCWGCLYTWLQRQKSCPTCKDYCDEDRVIPVYCRDAHTPNNELQAQYSGVPPRPAALRLLMPTLTPPADRQAASRENVGRQARRPFSLVLSAVRQGGWLRNLSVQHQVLLKQLLFFLGSVLILCLLLW